MTLNEYYITNVLSTAEQDAISERLHLFLSRIFSSSFADELFKIFKTVKIEERNRRDDVIAMTYPGRKIVLNTHVFYNLTSTEQVAYLAHELIHMAASKGNTKVRLLNRALWKFYNKNKVENADISLVMVGKSKVSNRWINKNETFPYLLTEPVRWQYLKPGSKELFMKIINKTRIFNLDDSFWKKQLSL